MFWGMAANPIISEKSLLHLYKATILPTITYGAPVFYNVAKQSHIKRIQVLQNKALRAVLAVPRYISVELIHQLTKQPKINDFVEKVALCYINKVTQTQNPIALDS